MQRTLLTAITLSFASLASAPAQSAWYLALGDVHLAGASFGPDAAAITLKFENDGPGAVKVTLSNNTAALAATISKVVFNMKNAFFGAGGASLVSGSFVSGYESDSIGIIKDSKYLGVANELYFDIELDFSSSNGFGSGLNSVFRFTSSAAGFDENAFKDVNLGADPDFVAGVEYNTPSGSGGSAAFQIHIMQGGQDAVPLPASVIGLVLLGAGLAVSRGAFGIV